MSQQGNFEVIFGSVVFTFNESTSTKLESPYEVMRGLKEGKLYHARHIIKSYSSLRLHGHRFNDIEVACAGLGFIVKDFFDTIKSAKVTLDKLKYLLSSAQGYISSINLFSTEST